MEEVNLTKQIICRGGKEGERGKGEGKGGMGEGREKGGRWGGEGSWKIHVHSVRSIVCA